MNIPHFMRRLVLCLVSAASVTVACAHTSPKDESIETVERLRDILDDAAYRTSHKEKGHTKSRWRLCALGSIVFCAGMYWWHSRRVSRQDSSPPSLALALQDSTELTAWFEAGVRAQAATPAAAPLVCTEFLHGVDRCVRANALQLPPLRSPHEQVPIHFRNAIIAGLVRTDDAPAQKHAPSSVLVAQQGTRADQCSIWHFCELVKASLPAPKDKERAGFACAEALLQLVARLRHGGDTAAAQEEIMTWLQQHYPQRVRGYTVQQRRQSIARLQKEGV
ncbi:MAG: hypothetical protein PVJ92_02610 [Candidatus Dependentiae bacterium]|jgi:hypothetical protein